MRPFFIRLLICLVINVPAVLADTSASSNLDTDKGMFAEFVGVCQGSVNTNAIWQYIGTNRIDLSWAAIEPEDGVWDEDALADYAQTALNAHAKGTEILFSLLYTASWAARTEAWSFTIGNKRYDVQAVDESNPTVRTAKVTNVLLGTDLGTITIPADRMPPIVSKWEAYVEKVVSTLSQPPYNIKYFQVWNEAHDQFTGFWWGGMDEYMNTIHLPAARIIHKYGCKVVYGGYPCCGSMPNYLSIIESHDAWDSIDVLDIHYFPLSAWDYLYNQVIEEHPNIGIWQTEVGFTQDTTWVSNNYPRFFYWALTHNWKPDRYKIFQFAYWSPNDPKAYGYQCCFLSSDSYSAHGNSLMTLGGLLDVPKVKPYTDWTTSPSLGPKIDSSQSSVEGFDCGDRIVLAIHLANPSSISSSAVDVEFPKLNMATIRGAYRVGAYGAMTRLSAQALSSGGVKVSVPIEVTNSSSMLTYYLLLVVNRTNSVINYEIADNAAAGSRWSCYTYYGNVNGVLTALSHQTANDAGTSWDMNYTPSNVNIRSIYNTGLMRADSLPIGQVYTVAADNPKIMDISGTWTPYGSVEWAGVKVKAVRIRDGSTTEVNAGLNDANVTVLWQGEWGGDAGWGTEGDPYTADTKTFDLKNILVETGDDLFFTIQWTNVSGDGASRGWWWEACAYLDVTIAMKTLTAGDADQDGVVNVSDLSLLAANYGMTSGATWTMGDFTGDGAVNVSDLSLLAANYGSGSSSSIDFASDYSTVFNTEDDTALEDGEVVKNSVCSTLGLSLVAGIMLMGLPAIKLRE